MKIYVASSWRNPYQQNVVRFLRDNGHEVYDFRNPKKDDHGFHWSEIDSEWEKWTPRQFREGLEHDLAFKGFNYDYKAMEWAEICVLVLPCGRSAHLEAGWFVGAGKGLYIYVHENIEPELMYLMAMPLVTNVDELRWALENDEADRDDAENGKQ